MEPDNPRPDDLAASLHDLLVDLPDTDEAMNRTSWTLRSPSTDDDHAAASRPSHSTGSRAASRPNILQQRMPPSTIPELSTVVDPGPSTSFSAPPSRSIFASGPPTASVSANTAHASLSLASSSNTSRPLGPMGSNGMGLLTSPRVIEPLVTATTVTIPGTEKDVDDPDSQNIGDRYYSATGTSHKLSSLFATDVETPGFLSREPTHFRSYSTMVRPPPDSTTLTGHLLYNGFLNGRHSDISIHAFGQTYKVHKLLLDRAPFFSSAFCGPWVESSAQEMVLHPGEIDQNITQTAFELALKRLYGNAIPAHEEEEAVGLFATACWLDMPDLVDSCVDYILRQMETSKLHAIIKLVTNNYYGKAGDRILTSAKAMLCREGWEMPYSHWDDVPAEVVREIIGNDAFYVPGEWERWFLATRILNRRLRRLATQMGLVAPNGQFLHPRPQSIRFFAVRFDTTYRPTANLGSQKSWSNKDDAWAGLYTSQDIAPILVLLEEGIHYIHLRFEQLQHIKTARDILGVPVLPEKVISDALWMSMELRQLVLNAHENDLELGLSETADDQELEEEIIPPSEKARGKRKEESFSESTTNELDSGSWDGNGRARKFWIPSTDTSCIMGGAKEAIATPSATSSGDWTAIATRLSASLEPNDVAWVSDFAGGMFESSSAARNVLSTSAPRYSHYPPFRFSAEFPNPRTLKERKRVYSQTVWYAGSMWSLYIQRVNTSKNQQLGIYLHRAKDKDPSDDPLAQLAPTTSIDDRLGQIEREILMRKNEHRRTPRPWREDFQPQLSSPQELGESSPSTTSPTANPPADLVNAFSSPRSLSYRDRPTASSPHKDCQDPRTYTPPTIHRRNTSSEDNNTALDFLPPLSDADSEDLQLLRAHQKYTTSNLLVSTMPPYTDTRPTIKTYFKIYSPSKAGRLLSVYESAPDSFYTGKSWGWKSSQMVLDDGLGLGLSGSGSGSGSGSSKDGKLRYMVVIGNI